MSKFLLNICSLFYKWGVALRHRLYDWRIIKSESFDIPIVCVGNITVGGTGKTPTAEYIISYLSSSYNIALLSRGYGRRTKGYREVKCSSSYLDVGDEPLQIKLKFPDTLVVVCEDRVEGIRRIRSRYPDINLIVMDDGFQHRKVTPKVNVIILDATRPISSDRMLPAGSLRDLPSRLRAAHHFIVTKCPEEMTPLDQRIWRKQLVSIAFQKVYFSRVKALPIAPLFIDDEREEVTLGSQAVLMAGIGNPNAFKRDMGSRFNIVDTLFFNDHHRYTTDDVALMEKMADRYPRAIILMTEKDAVKLRRFRRFSPALRRALYYQPIEMEIIEGSDSNFIGNLVADIEYVESD